MTHWGMSERLGPVSYKISDEDPFLGREIHRQRLFSEHTMELIDEEVARILHVAAQDAEKLLVDHRDAAGEVDPGAAGLRGTHRAGNPGADRPVGPRVSSEQQEETTARSAPSFARTTTRVRAAATSRGNTPARMWTSRNICRNPNGSAARAI